MAAHYVNAERVGVGSCLFAIICVSLLYAAISGLIPVLKESHEVIQYLVSLPVAAYVFSGILGTSYIKGLIIAIIDLVLTSVLVFLFMSLGIASS